MVPTLLIASSIAASRIVIGCSDNTTNPADASVDGGTTVDASATDGSGPVDAKVDLDAPVAHPGDDAGLGYVRVAQVNLGLGAVDFCIGEGDFKSATPALAAFAATGVTPAQVSRYVAASTRAAALRIVTSGATNCATGVGKDVPLKVSDSSYTTIVAFGASAADLALQLMPDLAPSTGFQDAATAPLVRVVHAAVGIGTLNFGAGSVADGNFTSDYPNLTFGKTAQPPVTDSLGYRRTSYWNTMSANAPGATIDVAKWKNIEWGEPAVGTLFLINDAQPQKVHALFCKHDSQIPKSGTTNPSCTLLVREP